MGRSYEFILSDISPDEFVKLKKLEGKIIGVSNRTNKSKLKLHLSDISIRYAPRTREVGIQYNQHLEKRNTNLQDSVEAISALAYTMKDFLSKIRLPNKK